MTDDNSASAHAEPTVRIATESKPMERVMFEVKKIIVGQDQLLERLIIGLLARGHVLVEGVPGLAKTMAIKSLAAAIGGDFQRIQFTPDLVPADLIGTRIYNQQTGEFNTSLGPVFTNLLLADEINRAPAKVQSALLEVMQERQVTIGDQTFAAPTPFLVMATQNPVESEGVYPLPEAQRDRFLMRVPVDYPTPTEELEIMGRGAIDSHAARAVLDPATVSELQARTAEVHVDRSVAEYALRLVTATRDPNAAGLPELDGLIEFGASPRASLALLACGRGLAVLRGRTSVSHQDVYDIAYDVLNHRLILSFAAVADGVGVDDVLVELLSTIAVR